MSLAARHFPLILARALWFCALCLVLPGPARAALAGLDDASMSAVSGTGIAIGLDNFQFAMAPSSYFEEVGSTPAPPEANNCTGTGSVASNENCWRRGDLRWYGINISGAGGTNDGYQWDDATVCSSSSLNCPRGGTIANFSPFDNPYIIRAWSPQGMSWDGGCVNGTGSGCNSATSNTTKSIYEFIAPSQQPNYTFSFWGEVEAGATRNSTTQALNTAGTFGSILKSQTMIRGNAAGSIFRLFQFPAAGANNYSNTFAMYYQSHLQGSFRFSVAQVAGSSDAIGVPPVFAAGEGLTFLNVNAFMPFGQLYYQALTLGPIGTSGNFYLQLTPVPNNATVYTQFYGLNGAVDTTGYGYETARRAIVSTSNTLANVNVTAAYLLSHGVITWGDWYPGAAAGTRNAINASNDGIFFTSCSICATFYAYAYRPITIDKRGSTSSQESTQNYNCATGNAGACSTAAAGPIFTSSSGDTTRTYPVTAGNPVNLGDSRIAGMLINQLYIQSCVAGGC